MQVLSLSIWNVIAEVGVSLREARRDKTAGVYVSWRQAAGLKLAGCNAVAETRLFQVVSQCYLVGWLHRIRRESYIFL